MMSGHILALFLILVEMNEVSQIKYNDICSSVFTAALFSIANIWQHQLRVRKMDVFIFSYSFFNAFFLYIWISELYHFSSLWRTYFTLPCKADLSAVHSTTFCVCVADFISFSILKVNCRKYRIVDYFSPNTLNIVVYTACLHGFWR